MMSNSKGQAEPGEQEEARRPAPSQRLCGWKLLPLLPLIAAIVLYFLPTILDKYEAHFGYGEMSSFNISPGIMDQFRVYDANGDGYIDPFEFVVLGVRLAEENDRFEFQDVELSPDGEVAVVKAVFQPIRLDSMSKFKDQQDFYFGSPEQLLPGLSGWKTAQHPLHVYGAGNFRAFLPPMDQYPLGKPYHIVDAITDETGIHMNRFRPPKPVGKEVLLHTLLTQFHPNVFLHVRFGPRGSIALVRASSEKYLDIVMRVHAEFQLNTEPHFPFWFTPGQFQGRLIIDRQAEHVEYFELALPADRQLNIDMEWVTGPGSNEVDIGYVPEMRLYSSQPSQPWEVESAVNTTDEGVDPDSLAWDQEVSLEQARLTLEKVLYPFKTVHYLPFLDAVGAALREGKLVHSLLLWGALDDQSC